MTAPVGKLVRYKAMVTGDIHNPGSGLKAFRNNPRLHVIRPATIPLPRFHDFATTNKPIPTVRHATPPSVNADSLAGASPDKNMRNPWVRDTAYYNLATFLSCIELPKAMADWSLTSLQPKLIKIGASVVRHARAISFHLAEVAVTSPMLRAIRRLRTPPLCA